MIGKNYAVTITETVTREIVYHIEAEDGIDAQNCAVTLHKQGHKPVSVVVTNIGQSLETVAKYIN